MFIADSHILLAIVGFLVLLNLVSFIIFRVTLSKRKANFDERIEQESNNFTALRAKFDEQTVELNKLKKKV